MFSDPQYTSQKASFISSPSDGGAEGLSARPLPLSPALPSSSLKMIGMVVSGTQPQLTMKHLVILQSLPGHTGAVTSACMLPHPEVIVTGALDADIRVWADKTYQVRRGRGGVCSVLPSGGTGAAITAVLGIYVV